MSFALYILRFKLMVQIIDMCPTFTFKQNFKKWKKLEIKYIGCG